MDDKYNYILCSDVIFKSLFLNLEDILVKFIYDITGYQFEHIVFYMNEIPIQRKDEKFKRCDFIIETDRNVIINIELNRYFSDTILVKNTGYVFSLFSRYSSKGVEYNKDLKVIQININCFSRFNKSVLDYRILNGKYGYSYFSGIEIWDLDVIQSKKLFDSDLKRKKRYIKWGALFSCTSIEEMEPILGELLSKKEVYLFMNKLKKITRIVTVMDEEEALREDDKFRRSLRNEGFSDGERVGFGNGFSDGIMSMIKSMFDNNVDKEVIAKVSNKSIEEIDKIIGVG